MRSRKRARGLFAKRSHPLRGGFSLFENNGSVGERLIPPDCKSGARKGYAGSNPARPTMTYRIHNSPLQDNLELRESCVSNTFLMTYAEKIRFERG